MLFSKKRTPPVGSAAAASVQQITTKRRGDAAEALAAEYLAARGLRLLQLFFGPDALCSEFSLQLFESALQSRSACSNGLLQAVFNLLPFGCLSLQLFFDLLNRCLRLLQLLSESVSDHGALQTSLEVSHAG